MVGGLFAPLPPPILNRLKVGSVGLLCEKVKQDPVLYDKQMKVYRIKDVVSNAWSEEKIWENTYNLLKMVSVI